MSEALKKEYKRGYGNGYNRGMNRMLEHMRKIIELAKSYRASMGSDKRRICKNCVDWEREGTCYWGQCKMFSRGETNQIQPWAKEQNQRRVDVNENFGCTNWRVKS